MKKPWIGVILILLGIIVAGFVALYLCLYGGIVQVIGGIKADWAVGQIAIGIVRVVCTGVAGSLSFMLFFIPGWAMLNDGL